MKNKPDLTIKGTGDPVIFLHGLGGDSNQWQKLLSKDLPFQMMFPDMPGHGQNNQVPESGFSFDSYTEEVKGLMDDDADKRYILAGISMGAGIAMRLTRKYPEKIKKVVLLRPAWLNNPFPANLDILYRLGIKWAAGNTEETRQWLLSDKEYILIKNESAACAGSVESQLNRSNPKLAARTLTDICSDAPIRTIDEIQSIDVPVLIIGTEKDPLHPVHIARQFHEWLPDSRFSLIASRYDYPEEHKEELNTVLAEFITGNDLPRG